MRDSTKYRKASLKFFVKAGTKQIIQHINDIKPGNEHAGT